MSESRVAVTIRPAVPGDRAATAQLVGTTMVDSPYAEVPAYFNRRAFEAADDEARIIVAEVATELVGCVIYGDIAGTVGTARIHFVTIAREHRRTGIGSALCAAAVRNLADQGARRIIVEMPDDGLLAAGRAMLERSGFISVARVADYYRDAVDLLVLERPLA